MRNHLLLQSKVSHLSAFLAVTSLFGCGSTAYPDVNADSANNNKATFQRDALDCANAYPYVDLGVHIKQRISCMNLKGWR